MIEVNILLKSGIRFLRKTEQINWSEYFLRFLDEKNVGVGIPIANIEYWEVKDVEEQQGADTDGSNN